MPTPFRKDSVVGCHPHAPEVDDVLRSLVGNAVVADPLHAVPHAVCTLDTGESLPSRVSEYLGIACEAQQAAVDLLAVLTRLIGPLFVALVLVAGLSQLRILQAHAVGQ